VASRARAGRFVGGLSDMSVAPGHRGAQCLLTTRQLAASCRDLFRITADLCLGMRASVASGACAWPPMFGTVLARWPTVGRQVFLVLAAQAVRNLLIGATFGRGAAGPRRVAGSESGSFALLEDEGKDGGDHKTL
jgi:hypothetical protein